MDFPAVEDVSSVTRSQFGGRADYVDPRGRFGEPGDGPFDVEDSASAFLRCAGNRTISLEIAWATNRPESNEVVIHGTAAGAKMEFGGDELTLYEARGSGTDHFVESTETGGSLDHTGWSGCDKVFFEAGSRDDSPEVKTVTQALRVQRVVDAIYRSADVGRSVALTDRE